MKYMILIYSNETAWKNLPEAQQHQIFGEYMGYTEEMKRTGVWAAGEALEPTTTATTVRVHNGRSIHVDGPFAETKEQLGGYYVAECKDLDEALKWAAKVPDVVHGVGSAEVRPVMVFPG
jgi:hypothetical protein